MQVMPRMHATGFGDAPCSSTLPMAAICTTASVVKAPSGDEQLDSLVDRLRDLLSEVTTSQLDAEPSPDVPDFVLFRTLPKRSQWGIGESLQPRGNLENLSSNGFAA